MADAAGSPGGKPIFIVGPMGSGTTLLRTRLDAHPNIAAGPEAPWLAEHQPRSVLGPPPRVDDDPVKHGIDDFLIGSGSCSTGRSP